ncbi:hypothetical protein E4U43_008488 [Claviceps pusilla]|uniref:Uncharacterized protein n=1 Tax=Claviceps pusilla TaxID=123648 RepID=A0A9P7NB32_9HYPO|nr:hypothetical protein E4U43_008488 [Claviceps pusilla]
MTLSAAVPSSRETGLYLNQDLRFAALTTPVTCPTQYSRKDFERSSATARCTKGAGRKLADAEYSTRSALS